MERPKTRRRNEPCASGMSMNGYQRQDLTSRRMYDGEDDGEKICEMTEVQAQGGSAAMETNR